MYDDVMSVDTAEGATNMCYADDLAAVITANDEHELIVREDQCLYSVKKWMERNKLSIAPIKLKR